MPFPASRNEIEDSLLSMKLLVPVDGSPLAEQALPIAASISTMQEVAEIRLVLVDDRNDLPAYRDSPWSKARSSMEYAYLERKARELRSIVWSPVFVEHPTGDAVDSILAIAKEAGSDLIVMTTHGRTGFRREWVGSVADGVMRSAGVPVLMLRSSDRPPPAPGRAMPFSRVLIPLDGSREAETILEEAVAVAGKNATYVLAQVVEPVPSVVPGEPFTASTMMSDPEATDLVARDARQYLQEVASRLAGRGVGAVEQSVLIGDHPAQMLLDLEHTDEAIDLVALATHGRGLARLILGSVADKLLRGSRTPLLVCRRTPS